MIDEAAAAAVILGGGVVAAATETFFGLLADAGNPSALDQLGRLKPRERPSALLVATREDCDSLVSHFPPPAGQLADSYWPGPLTLVLPAAQGVDPRLLQDGQIGVRVPGECAARRIAKATGRPLTATSANPPGSPAARLDSQIEGYFSEELVRGALSLVPGEAPGGRPSTVLAIDEVGLHLLREGAISVDAIAALVHPLRVRPG